VYKYAKNNVLILYQLHILIFQHFCNKNTYSRLTFFSKNGIAMMHKKRKRSNGMKMHWTKCLGKNFWSNPLFYHAFDSPLPPIDPLAIANGLGIEVIRVTNYTAPSLSVMADVNSGIATISYRPFKNDDRKTRFYIAYGIGLVIMAQRMSFKATTVPVIISKEGRQGTAYSYAVDLLMPEADWNIHIKNLSRCTPEKRYSTLAKYFQVPSSEVELRYHKLYS